MEPDKVTAGFEPAMTVLQTGALPLGYRAVLSFFMTSHFVVRVLQTGALPLGYVAEYSCCASTAITL